MSENTQCNYCRFQEIQRTKPSRFRITLLPDTRYGTGINVYVHPREVKIRKLPEAERKQYWRRWFMELPDRCCC